MRLTLTATLGVTAILCGLASAAPIQPVSPGEDDYTSIEMNGIDQPVNEHEYDEIDFGFSTQKRSDIESEVEVEMYDFTQPFEEDKFKEVEMYDFLTKDDKKIAS